MNIKSFFLCVSALGFLLGSPELRAAIIFDTEDAGAGDVAISSTSRAAQSFIPNDDYTLTSVVLNLFAIDEVVGTGTFVVSLYNAAETGAPGTLLANFSGPTSPAVQNLYPYTPSEPVNLDAGATYYVVASVVGGDGIYQWRTGGPEIIIAPSVAVGYRTSSRANEGMEWGNWGELNEDAPDHVLDLQVNGDLITPVPEPVNVGLAIFGMLLVGGQSFRWWNTRRTKLN